MPAPPPDAGPATPGPAQSQGRLRAQLSARGFELLDAPPPTGTGPLAVSAGRLHDFHPPGHGTLAALVPVQLRLHLDAQGDIQRIEGGTPSAGDIAAAGTALDDLIADGRLDDPAAGGPVRGATHAVVTGPDGRRVVRRRGYDAAPGG